jgi:paraquat-inducible protein B
MPSTILQVQDAAQSLLAKLQAVDFARLSAGVQTVLDDVHGQLTQGDLHGTLAEAHTLLATLRAAVEVADLPGLAADLRATSGSVRTLVQGKQFKQLTASAADAADNFDEAAKRLPGLLDALATTVARVDNGVGDVQHDLEPLLRDARAAISNLRETTETLRHYPSSVLLGAPPPHAVTR